MTTLDPRAVKAALDAYGIDAVVDGLEAAIAAYLAATQPQAGEPGLVERVARAWASIDGRLDRFEQGKAWTGKQSEAPDGGTYDGYIADTQELLRRAGITSPQPANPAQGVSTEELLVLLKGCLSREDEDGGIWVPADYIHSAIAAIGAGGQAVAVKPVDWRNGCASTSIGDYLVVEEDWDDEPFWFVMLNGKTLNKLGEHRDEASAIAAAQADYERRILSALSQPHPADERVVEALDEGLSILTNLIDNIKRHGNYSAESTCMFIDQAGASIRAGRRALTGGKVDG